MELIRGIHNLHSRHYGCVLTIGNFDGFHRGHQALVAALQTLSLKRRLPVMVMIFEPHPQEYFSGSDAPFRLTRLRDKVKYLAGAGIDAVLCVTFNRQFASLSANAFVTELLVKKLGVRFIGVGDDFRFGARRLGNCALLTQAGKKAGFQVIKTMTYTEGDRRISSTAIREALSQDKLVEAEILLGHSYRISGRVIRGAGLGRTINFPTANVSLKGRQTPINGVYTVEVCGIGERSLPGVANIGIRPTLSGQVQRLELHLLDVAMNLYGQHIEVVIRTKLRDEQMFKSLDDLRRQIANDVVSARDFFGLATPNHIQTENDIENREWNG
ncbi:bifunctional riboflavin kinase/FAD synthetase [Candidatus Steffania adelgidicola]|uniref:bifunctional riboflavin kinase/FAD synthetase n=1 Tax=Candidatus Steffania adelgidicola TaxID=1076626 RepID=UPI001D002276|nr:bifunctional riboflavin kinase/FAD synthetase [Candidatus Steffania adelgidicola]UDG79911.1 Riboflavin biosynthesis protein RibF [Candidatus Steffania adelgidicola]